MELDRIWNYQWNAERVVIFQTVLFQRVSGVFGSRNIHDQIDSLLDLYNKGSYNELVQDCHRAAEEDLGGKRGTQTQEQRHRTFSNPFLNKLSEAVHFICEQDTGGGGVLPDERESGKTGYG